MKNKGKQNDVHLIKNSGLVNNTREDDDNDGIQKIVDMEIGGGGSDLVFSDEKALKY